MKCYTSPKIANVALGVGYFWGENSVYCDDGSFAKVEISGWSFFSAGLSIADSYQSLITFNGQKHVEEIEGTYFGGGIQVAVPLVLNSDLFVFGGTNSTLRWGSPAQGVAAGLPFRILNVEIIPTDNGNGVTRRITPPTVEYATTLRILESLKFKMGPLNQYGDHSIDYSVDLQKVPMDSVPREINNIAVSISLREDDVFGSTWGSRDHQNCYDWDQQTRLQLRTDLEAGEDYCIDATYGYTGNLPPVTYHYCFDAPEQWVVGGEIITTPVRMKKWSN